MQIRIEIDVKPEELRRLLGLPDIAGLQEDVVRFLREKVNVAGENFDAATVVQGSVDLLKRTPAWRLLKAAWEGTGAAPGDGDGDDAEDAGTPPPAPARPRRSAGTARRRPRKPPRDDG